MTYEVSSGFLLELRDTDITNIVIQHFAAHTTHAYCVTHDFDDDGLCHTLSGNCQRNGCFNRTTHHLDRFGQGQAFGGGVIDFDNQIPSTDTCTGSRGILDRRNDFYNTVFGAHFNSQTTKLTLGRRLHFLESIRIQISRVRIQV